MKSLISHGKMFRLYVGCYGELVFGKEMTCSDRHLRKIWLQVERGLDEGAGQEDQCGSR